MLIERSFFTGCRYQQAGDDKHIYRMKNIITTLLILLGLNSMGQTVEKLNNLFGKTWKIKTYEISGQNFPAQDNAKDDYTIFYSDHSAKAVDRETTHLSKWKYDAVQNILTLYSENTKEETEMKIFVLSETEFVWETTNPEGMTMTIHMFSSTEK